MLETITPFIPAIIGLFGVIIGSVFGGIIPHYLREKAEYKKFRKNKLEELYVDIEKWINTLFNNTLLFNLVFRKDIDWNTYLDEIKNSDPNKEVKYPKSKIIINMYFNELSVDFNKLAESFQEMSRLINQEIKKTYSTGSDILIHKPEFDIKVKNIIDLSENLKSKIIALSQRI
jgi:hypothetical protein